VVVDSRGNVHLVYLKGDPKACDVFYAQRSRGQTNFSAPIKVNTEPGSAIAIGTVRGAQLAIGRDGWVHVVWNGSQPARDPGAKGAPMLYARMRYLAHGFEPERNLMTSTMNLDGGGSVAADPFGDVYVVWHAHSRTGPDDESHRAVYVASSSDDGKTFKPEAAVHSAEGVCGCCGLKAFADSHGHLAVLYRAADESANRDSVLLLSRDHGRSFDAARLGAWRSPTCPMSTPALGNGPGKGLLAMWETQGQVYRRVLEPEHFDAEGTAVAADKNPGNRKHPVFAFDSDKGSRLLMAWVEGTGWEKGGSLAWEWIDTKTGATRAGSQPGVPVWGLATVAPDSDGGFTIYY